MSTFTSAYIIYLKFINPADNNADHWLFGISPEGIGTLGMIFNFIVAYMVSRVTAAPPEEQQDMVESIRIPEKRRRSFLPPSSVTLEFYNY